jgi:hypothetical protein
MSAVAQAYWRATLRQITPRVAEWLEELVGACGEDAVVAAIEAEAARGDHARLLGRVRERLARERPHPEGWRRIDRAELLAIARGEQPLVGRVWFDTADLSAAEYDEVLAWTAARRWPS